MAVDIKNTLGSFHSHILSNQYTPRGLGTGWQQDPVTLEDALGFKIPLPLELVDSWDVGNAQGFAWFVLTITNRCSTRSFENGSKSVLDIRKFSMVNSLSSKQLLD
jgi:hypothetical protein